MAAVKLTLDQLKSLDPCNLNARVELFGRRKSLTAKQALEAGASVTDILWVAGRLGMKRECVLFALRCAQRVAHLNPDPRVQGALDATQAWLDAPTAEAAAWAANAARDADEAAWAARDADEAAWAARAAARAAGATEVAEVAAWAARAAEVAARATGATEQEAQKAILLEIFG